MSSPAATPPRGRRTPERVLGAVAFAAVGFVAVWQGFGAAGYGTDAHLHRATAAVALLLIAGLALVWPRTPTAVRVLIVPIGLGTASWAWWDVRSSSFKSAVSLCEAAESRDQYKERLATATVDDFERHQGFKGITLLFDQYPSLTRELAEEYARWRAGTADELVARYGRVPVDDFTTVAKLRTAGQSLVEVHPQCAERLDEAFHRWLSNARSARTGELSKQPLGDWAGFDRTAPGRKALADAFPEVHAALVRAEDEWVDSSIELTVSNNLMPKAGEPPTRRSFWTRAQAAVLALKSLDPAEGRFRKARLRLFVVAHRATQAEVAAHLGAGRYDLAFGLARAHAVDWSATAAILGADELKKLDALRETCEFLNKLASKAAPAPDAAEVAPPPRTKP